MNNRFPFKLRENLAKCIIANVCPEWRKKLAELWGEDLLLQGEVYISETLYKEGREVCSPRQYSMLDDIFGKDEPTYKIGDWVYIGKETNRWGSVVQITSIYEDHLYANTKINTNDWFHVMNIERLATEEEIETAKNVCPYKNGELIFVKSIGIWTLKYFAGRMRNGEAACYVDQKKEGSILYWKNHRPAPGVTLPD